MAKKKAKQVARSTRNSPASAAPKSTANATQQPFLWISLALAAFAFLLYANTLGFGYVLDDPLAIGKNDLVRKGVGGIAELFTHHYRAGTEGAGASALLYRPLSLVTFAFEWSVAPESPALGHFMNVLWYALTVGLLFTALRHILWRYHWLWAAATALLFAAHPLHTEVVANIKSRDEILNVFFSVAALYGWARWLKAPAGKWLAVALISYFFALLSKESAVTLLPVFPLISWFFFDRTARQSGGHALLAAVPVVVFLLIRATVLSQTADNFVVSEMDNPIVAAQGLGEHTATSFMVLWKYFQLLVFPHPLLSDYSYRHLMVVDWTNYQAIAGLLLYGALIFFAVRGLLRRQVPAFSAAAFLCAIVLYSQLPLVIGTLFGERLMYMPSLWFCLGITYVLWQVSGFSLGKDLNGGFWPPRKNTQAGIAAFAVIALFFGYKTITRNTDWRDNITLFQTDSAKAPNSVRLHNGVGSELYTQLISNPEMPAAERDTLLAQVVQHSEAAISIKPNPVSFLNLGNAAIARNQYAESIRNYELALKEAPNYGIARINLGRTYAAWGREEGMVNNNLSRAAELLEKALEYRPDDAEVYLNLGASYGMMGQTERAIPYLEKAVELNPQNKNAWKNLGVAYRATGQPEKAEACLRRAGM
ncbi:MAG: tetratricopeptide repeat protein [Bacteroidetes bacterium]|nr:MAG: tetratricopeptide repeat protein [Bacteroidota bacterium]